MAQIVLELPAPHLTVIEGSRDTKRRDAPSTEMVVLCIGLAILQILDGILTALGVKQFGTGAEGNPFLRSLMIHFGHVEALVIMKCLALGIISVLYYLSPRVRWMPIAMRGMVGLYLVSAIIPWSIILWTYCA